jgi:hypothetical protein
MLMPSITRTAAILISLGALLPWAHAAPLMPLSDATNESARCGTLASSCCCESAAEPIVSGGCACAPTPVRAPAPAPASPTDDAPRVPTLLCLGVASAVDAAPLATSTHDRAHRMPWPDGAPPGRLLYCVFRL